MQLDRMESLGQARAAESAVRLRGGVELPVSRSRREMLEARLAGPAAR